MLRERGGRGQNVFAIIEDEEQSPPREIVHPGIARDGFKTFRRAER